MINKKNIIMVVVDALRPKSLSLFGRDKEFDKNLKKIAGDGILFRNHFSVSNCTAPSVTSVLTGNYPPKHGILHQLPYTKDDEFEKVGKVKFWFPEYLRENGYETIAIDWIGLWFKRGFDYYGEGDSVDVVSAPFKSAENITDLAISKIEESNKPFFLLLHYWDTHFPFPHTEYLCSGSGEDVEKTLNGIKGEKQRSYLERRIAGKNLYTIQDMKNKYDLSIESADKEIGRLYDFLKECNLLENSVFMVMGDHGMNLTEHEIYFSPSGLYDDSIHTPLIMRFPGIGAHEIDGFVQNIDIVPTVLDYLGLETEEIFDGKSCLSLIKDGREIRDKIISFDGLCEDIRTVRTNSRKLIVAKNNFCNLCKASHHEEIEEYDLDADPGEIKNIYSGDSELMLDLN